MAWQQQLRSSFTNWQKLADFLALTDEQRARIPQRSRFPLLLPLRLAEKIEKSTLDDPILRQFLPMIEEENTGEGFVMDPVGDQSARCGDKMIHKYEGRVLLVCTSACAMHCRYCFRQNFDYKTVPGFERELQMIAEDSSIREVILSGGDPLSLPDSHLKPLLLQLDRIPHIKRIRFHSRFLIGIPERIDPSFCRLLRSLRSQVWFVIHSNHPRELDADVLSAIQNIQQAGAVVLNQSVLLKGVNDQADVLKELSETLVDHGILPYYLHQLDRVQGAMHFEVEEQKGKELIHQLTGQLSGYAVPRFVREIEGEPSKTAL